MRGATRTQYQSIMKWTPKKETQAVTTTDLDIDCGGSFTSVYFSSLFPLRKPKSNHKSLMIIRKSNNVLLKKEKYLRDVLVRSTLAGRGVLPKNFDLGTEISLIHAGFL